MKTKDIYISTRTDTCKHARTPTHKANKQIEDYLLYQKTPLLSIKKKIVFNRIEHKRLRVLNFNDNVNSK